MVVSLTDVVKCFSVMTEQIQLSGKVPQALSGKRLDQVAAELFSSYSRSMLKRWIEEAALTVNSDHKRPKDKVFAGDALVLNATLVSEGDMQAQDMPLDIVFEDAHIAVINKPAGLVVHPAVGNADGTLLNGLLFHYPALAHVPRAGIVHRLDKDTTGLMVVAKTLEAHTSLVAQLQERTVKRQYAAVVTGVLTAGGTVDAPMGRHPTNRLKMAVVGSGKRAVTHYRVAQRFRAHTHVTLNLETGRTHQIRVHMSHLYYPIVGDATYGARRLLPKGAGERLIEILTQFKRQALHAERLGLIHPATDEYMEWSCAVPEDFSLLLQALETDVKQHKNTEE